MMELSDVMPAEGLRERRTTPDRVADAIREAILTGRLVDGAELNQVALAEHFQVSRVPVREALRQLQAEGLVRQEAHRRAIVDTLTLDRVMELFDLRVLLETYMLRRAVLQMDDRTLEELEELVAQMAEMEDHGEWLLSNREFHRRLYAEAQATFTQEFAAQCAARTARYLYQQSGGAGMESEPEAQAEHEEILRAVRTRDPDRAVAALEKHINGTRERVRAFLAERDAPSPDGDS